METLIDLRYNGSQQDGLSRTPEAPIASAERKIPPTLSWLVRPSSTSTTAGPAGIYHATNAGSCLM